MEQQTEIVMEAIGDVTLFDIKGDVTALSESPLNEAYEKAKAEGVDKIIMRFKKDAYINSGGIALLIQILAKKKKTTRRPALPVCRIILRKSSTWWGSPSLPKYSTPWKRHWKRCRGLLNIRYPEPIREIESSPI